ncbi:MAG: periplasmic heavy metal sensor [Geminicoccaceae bacterium]|jgi:Spy/CpxP family protein refolding chaperone|nr:periplasmic heavy metal sensor [Geminicoccaceae bacterium]MCB9967896.1 periplasmic heavy metal sensor [Geminicoccaceae bacterium]HRY25364.1 periplasmic heavy metal sensor [Geminicoccaceae bacterium]
MTDGKDTNGTGQAGGGQHRAPTRWGHRILIGGAVLVVAVGVGAGVVAATGSGWHGGWHHGGMRDFAEWRLTRALDAVDARPEQQARITAIAEATHDELAPMMEALRGARGELAALLVEPVIDKAAVEELRSSRMAMLDDASKRAVAALLEAAEVLDPAQRAALAARLEERRGRRGLD